MAKPNYSFEKRQRELAKKKKQDEKDAKKRAEKKAKAGESGQDAPALPPDPCARAQPASSRPRSASFSSQQVFIHCWKRARTARSSW